MSPTTASLLEAWNKATDLMRACNSQIQAAAELFLEGTIDREELTRYSNKAKAAVKAANDAERAYRSSYRAEAAARAAK